MKALVDIPTVDIQRLNALKKKRKVSRAALVREAISLYLKAVTIDGATNVFGIWSEHKEDAVKQQRKMRAEWNGL